MVKNTSKESLAEKTGIYIDSHPSVKDCVSRGLINYSSLARMIMKDLDLDNEEAVMIACRTFDPRPGQAAVHHLSGHSYPLRDLNSLRGFGPSFFFFILTDSHSAHTGCRMPI